MWRTLCLIPVGFCLTLVSGCTQNGQTNADPPLPVAGGVRQASAESTAPSGESYKVKFETSKGDFVILVQHEWAPNGADRFAELVENGFYNDCRFFRVINGFMAQGGDPLGVGHGGPGYKYNGEFSPTAKHDKPGILSMANAGPGTDGSQFFLTFGPTPHLDGKHTVFGEVVDGMDTVKALEARGSRSGKTKEPLLIETATIDVE
jgi:peptidyl-prolyl cis-trans isomerase B (cyclophilin B)